MKAFLVWFLLSLALIVPSPLVAKSPEVEHAIQTLVVTDTVMSSHVGAAGLLSHNTEAFRVLVAQKDGGAAFREIFQKAEHPAGKIYGLLGLRQVSKTEYDSLRPSLKADTAVQTIRGCMIMNENAGVLLKQIEDGSLLLMVNPPESRK